MALALRACKFCNMPGLAWQRLAKDRWVLFELDAQGRKIRNHTERCSILGKRLPTITSGAIPEPSPIPLTADAILEAVNGMIPIQANEPIPSPVASPAIQLPKYRATSPLPTAIPQSVESDLTDTLATVAELVAPEPEPEPELVPMGEPIEHESGFLIPPIDPSYLIDAVHLAAIKRRIRLATATGHPQNIGLHGPAGSGKTTLGIQIGALYGAPTVIVDSTDKETANDWFGTQQLADGTLTFIPSDFVKAVETPGAVVILDDVALIQNRTVQSGLNALLDPSRRAIYVQQLGRTVRVAPGVVFVGTWNVGSEYTSASELSLQLIDRFRSGALFDVPYPTDGVLAKILRARTGLPLPEAERLANVADWLRADPNPIECSTRGLVGAGESMVHGATIGEALFSSVFGEYADEDRQRAFGIIAVNLARNGYDPDEQAEWETPKTGTFVPITVG